jgi:small subunit ribosomal protein S24
LILELVDWDVEIVAANLEGGLRASETAVEDMFIRKFMVGTWHSLFVSEVIIKRQHNIIRIAGIIRRSIGTRKMYFLIGYTEEFLSFWLQCPIKLELQTVADRRDVVFKYI